MPIRLNSTDHTHARVDNILSTLLGKPLRATPAQMLSNRGRLRRTRYHETEVAITQGSNGTAVLEQTVSTSGQRDTVLVEPVAEKAVEEKPVEEKPEGKQTEEQTSGEAKLAEEKMVEVKLGGDMPDEQNADEQKTSEEKTAEEKIAEEKAAGEKTAEEKT